MLGFQVFIFHMATIMLKTYILFGRLTSLKFFLKKWRSEYWTHIPDLNSKPFVDQTTSTGCLTVGGCRVGSQ